MMRVSLFRIFWSVMNFPRHPPFAFMRSKNSNTTTRKSRPEWQQYIRTFHENKKLAYNQSMEGSGRIPVSRLVHASLPEANKGVPAFFSRPAGLPGGLSLIA